MKIAIQGHFERCKEVIDTLINLGGINKHNYVGDDSYLCYYIDECKHIEAQFLSKIDENFYKCYTIEEFEKEFPFKIGDKVTVISNIAYRVIALEDYKGRLCYKLNNGLNYSSNTLTLYKEMKEERNITLTLDKAKEWHQKGGELREIALQAFTEKELNPFPKWKWEEYYKTHYVATNIFGPCAPLKYIALWKLEQLRDCYRQGWKPDWTNARTNKYCIYYSNNELDIIALTYTCKFLSFQSEKVAEEFLKNFKSLIKEAGDLI